MTTRYEIEEKQNCKGVLVPDMVDEVGEGVTYLFVAQHHFSVKTAS